MHPVLAVNVLSASSLLGAFGALGVLVALFAETGLLVGFFLPGDSLLFTAGVLSATAPSATVHLALGWVIAAAVVGATLGGQTGYLIGRRAGPVLLDRPDRPRLAEAVRRARRFVARYGTGKALVLARFVPLVRTAVNPLVGVLRVPARTFAVWNAVGGVLWTVGVTVAGYVLGSSIPNIDHYLLPVIAVIIVLSLIPVVREAIRLRRSASEETP